MSAAPYVKCRELGCECNRGHEARGDADHMDARGRRWRTPQVQPTAVLAQFACLHPAGHELAGRPVEREQKCSRCGRPFTQQRIDPAWLNAFREHSPSMLKAFLATCEVDESRHVFTPGRCATCERASLNNQPVKPSLEKSHA